MSKTVKQDSAILVLGMHRSGTSVIARALQELGVELGNELLSAHADENPRGYFEDVPLLEISDSVLAELGMRWDSLRLIEPSEWDRPALHELELKAAETLRSRFGDVGVWGFKNPRTARLLPFWQRVMARVGREDSYVLAIRNPLSVARSLKRRNGFVPVKSYLLWLLHMTEAVMHSQGKSLVCIDFDRLLAQPASELSRLSNALEIPGSQENGVDAEAFSKAFLDSQFRNSKFEVEDLELDSDLSLLARKAFGLLHAFSRDQANPSRVQLQRAFARFSKQLKEIAPLFAHLDDLDVQLEAQRVKTLSLTRDLETRTSSLEERDGQLVTAGSEIEMLQGVLKNERQVFDSNREALSEAHAELGATRERFLAKKGELTGVQEGLKAAQAEAISIQKNLESYEVSLREANEKISQERSNFSIQQKESAARYAHDLQALQQSHLSERAQEDSARAQFEEGLREELAGAQFAVDRHEFENRKTQAELTDWLHAHMSYVVTELTEACRVLRDSNTWKMTSLIQRVISFTLRREWLDGSLHLQKLLNELYAESQKNHIPVETLAFTARETSQVLGQLLASQAFWVARKTVNFRRVLSFRKKTLTPLELLQGRLSEVLFFLEGLNHSPIAHALSALPAEDPRVGRILDVVIPVHNAREATLRCIESVLRTANQAWAQFDVIVVDDASSDVELKRALDVLFERGEIKLIRNEVNLGFPSSVNRGMALNGDRDVVLLNSDTLVHGDWIDRLRRAALSDWKIATVTPFSNNGEICSYPTICQAASMPDLSALSELDGRAASANAGLSCTLPTAVGFCMYIRRQALDEVGNFDSESFEKGYGEENDFSLRAEAMGYRNLLAADVFVAHEGGSSFLESKEDLIRQGLGELKRRYPDYEESVHHFIANDPIRWLRQRIQAGYLAEGGKRAVLMVTHFWGGGTERHVQELSASLEAEGTPVLILKSNAEGRVELKRYRGPELSNLVFDLSSNFDELVEVLRLVPVGHIHFHHLIGFDLVIRDLAETLGVTADVSIHDYFMICPRINMVNDSDAYCGSPEPEACNACVRRNGSELGFEVNVEEWRAESLAFLQRARRVFVPSEDVVQRMHDQMPGVDWCLRPHPESEGAGVGVSLEAEEGGPLRVAVIGAIGLHKGAAVLEECAMDAAKRDLPLHFHIIGYTDRDSALLSTGAVSIGGSYAEENLQSELIEARCQVAFLPSVWPETFCYTLSAAFEGQLYPVAFDLGAVAERIRAADFGELISLRLSAAEINDHLLGLRVPRSREPSSDSLTFARYENYLSHYYDGLNL